MFCTVETLEKIMYLVYTKHLAQKHLIVTLHGSWPHVQIDSQGPKRILRRTTGSVSYLYQMKK